MLRKPFGAMVSSPDQTQQVPFMFFLIIHYFERPASSVRLVKSIHLRAYRNIGLSMNCNAAVHGQDIFTPKGFRKLTRELYVIFKEYLQYVVFS